MAMELAHPVTLQRALDRQFLPVGLRAANGAKDRSWRPIGGLKPGDDMRLAKRRVAGTVRGIVRACMDQPRGAQNPLGEKDEMRDHLADITALGPEAQPVGLLLPGTRPGGTQASCMGRGVVSESA